jgi:hypothetical protein
MRRKYAALVITAVFCGGLMQAQTLTRVQQAIVNATRNASGPSPASHVNFIWNGAIKSGWLTDMAGGDGARIRTAINRYAAWRPTHVFQPIPSTLITAMKNDVAATYRGTDGINLVNQITYMYDLAMITSMRIVAPPQTDEQTLTFLGIRQQCKEWADMIVIKAGGTQRPYGSGIQTSSANFRAGMGLFFPGIPHASIITDVIRNSNSSIQFRIAESNWGTGWGNPSGMIPWNRTLQNIRVLDWLGNNTCRIGSTNYTCQVVSFE